MTSYIAECTDSNGEEFTIETKFVESSSIAAYKAGLEKNGYIVHRVVTADDHHICKYCKSIADGKYEDLLCEDCQHAYGQTFFSDL